jgi:hypothetical protein
MNHANDDLEKMGETISDLAADPGLATPVAPPDRLTAQEIEALETDGRGTGGIGADLGGHDPLPEEEEE